MSGVITALSTTVTASSVYEVFGAIVPFVAGLAVIFLSIYVIKRSLQGLSNEKVRF